jgi:thiosulfate dehydrogenase [quinone] large subunit
MAAVRIIFGLIWLVDAGLKWSPTFAGGFVEYVSDEKAGQPAAVKAWLDWWVTLLRHQPHLFAHILAVAETVIAVGLIVGAFTNLICVGGAVLSVAIWSTAEGFGGPYAAGSTDVGTSIIYVVVFAALLISNAGGWASADHYLRRYFGVLCALPVTGVPNPSRKFIVLAGLGVAAGLAIGLGVAFIDKPAPPGTMHMIGPTPPARLIMESVQ